MHISKAPECVPEACRISHHDVHSIQLHLQAIDMYVPYTFKVQYTIYTYKFYSEQCERRTQHIPRVSPNDTTESCRHSAVRRPHIAAAPPPLSPSPSTNETCVSCLHSAASAAVAPTPDPPPPELALPARRRLDRSESCRISWPRFASMYDTTESCLLSSACFELPLSWWRITCRTK